MKGKIVLLPFPFTDLTAHKLRPALILHEGLRDVIVAFISSKTRPFIEESDILITRENPFFQETGLQRDSIIKLDKLATIAKDLVLGELGEIDEDTRQEVNQKLKALLEL